MGNGDITIVPFEKKYQDACVSMFMDGLGTQGNTEEILQLQRWFVKQKTDPKTGDMYDISSSYMNNAGCTFFVALDGSNPIGCVAIAKCSYAFDDVSNKNDVFDFPGATPENVCELQRMTVHSSYRNSGVGSKLVNAVLHHAKNRGMNRVVLSTLQSMHPARCLYERCGFEPFRETRVDVKSILGIEADIYVTHYRISV